jgi:Tol biopolymer transport system component
VSARIIFLLGLAVLLATSGTAAGATRSHESGRLALAIRDATGNADIYTMRPDGNDAVRLTTDPSFDLCASWSRDARQIAFCSNRSGSFQIWAMNADGSNQHQITGLGGSATFPDFSPNARKVVFDGAETPDGNSNIYVVNADGTGLTPLTSDGNNLYPVYSPNGRKIAFVSDRTGVEQVWLMNADGSQQTQLSHSGINEDQLPDWSPDGTRIAFEQGDLGSGRIFVMNADGSHQHAVSSGAGDDFGAAWSPDGSQIAFVRDLGNGDRRVWIVDKDGTGEHPVQQIPLTEFVPGWSGAENDD